MARYAQLTDTQDPMLTNVAERHLLSADSYVDGVLREKGIAVADVVLPKPLLTDLAANWALRLAAIEGGMGDNSPLIDKAKQYEAIANTLAKLVGRDALGIAAPIGTSFGVVTLGRG